MKLRFSNRVRTGQEKIRPARASQFDRSLNWAGAAAVEELERRLLLTALLSNAVQRHIDPTTAQQALFAPGVSSYGLFSKAGLNVIGQQFYRFTVADTNPAVTTTFSTSSIRLGQVDAALALYDADGNLLQTADADKPFASFEHLSANLTSGTPYVLDVLTANIIAQFPSTPPRPVTLTVDTGQQRINSPIKIDPTAGTAEFLANTPPDTFTSPDDVNYFPIDLTNVGQTATVALNPSGPDVQFFGELFRQDGPTAPWQEVASGSGVPLSLAATPPSGGDITDSRYLLAASPLNFNTAAQAYKVDLSSTALLGPGSLSNPVISRDLSTPGPTALGVADATLSDTLAGSSKVYRIRAITTGPFVLKLNSTAFPPLMSVYDTTGATLMGVSSSTGTGTITFTLNATAGTSYLVRLAGDKGVNSGAFTFDAKQNYTPTPLTVSNTVAQQTALSIDPSHGGQVFRLTPTGADYLVLQLTPDASSTLATNIVVVGTTLPPVQASAAAGQSIFLPLDLTKVSGPLDVYVVGTSGTGTATLSYATVSVPRQVPIGQFPTQSLDLVGGGLSTIVNAPAFGQMAGVQFYEISPGASESLSAGGISGAQTLLVRYLQQGSVLQLDDRALPGPTGTATLTATLHPAVLYGLAAINLNLNSGGQVVLSVVGPMPQGVGVAMVPDPPPPPPNQPPAQPPFVSKVRIRNVVIQQPTERDLWATNLPFNMTGAPTLTFTPFTTGGSLAVKITVLGSSNNVITSFTTQPGQALVPQTLSSITTALAGKTVRFLVEPLAGQPLGDGMYSLEMDAPTTDPNPYLATETTLSPSQVGPATSIPFGSSALGVFNSSQPTIDFYSFTLPNLVTPFQITTHDISTTVDTDIKLYRAHYSFQIILGHLVNAIDSYVELPTEPAPSFDYFPADRSTIDARIVVNNFHVLDNAFVNDPNETDYSPGANTLYVSVKNEQATQGLFTISVGAIPVTLVGPGTTSNFQAPTDYLPIDPESGTGSDSFVGSNYTLETITPHGLSGAATVTVTDLNGTSADVANVQLYDTSNHLLAGASATTFGQHTFFFAMSPSSAYFWRIFLNSGNPTSVSISAPVTTSTAPNPPADFDFLTQSTGGVGAYAPTEPYTRATPAPDGTYSLEDFYDPGSSGTLDKVVFYVASPGNAQFNLAMQNISNASYALYLGGGGPGGEFGGFHGSLLDFNSVGSNLSFTDFLTPGFYYLRLVGATPNDGRTFGRASISFSVTAFNAQKITLDPNSAENDTAPLRTVDDNPYFGTDFYEVDAPGGVQSDLAVDLSGLYLPPTAIDGQGIITIFKKSGSSFVQVGDTGMIDYYSYFGHAGQNPVTAKTIHSGDTPAPGDQYFIGFDRDRLGQNALIGPMFTIPQSGNPDLVVDPIKLEADSGRTRVTVTVRNQAFASAPPSHGQLVLSNYPAADIMSQAAIGPFGTNTFFIDWDPDAPSNTATFTANYDKLFQETNFNNNTQSVALSTVDAVGPTISIALKDPSLTGESAANTWGRYVSGVTLNADVLVTSNDADTDLYQTNIQGLGGGGFTASGGNYPSSHVDDVPVDFGFFRPTSPSNPNEIHYSAIDAYGLRSGDHVQYLDVVPTPQFLTSISWDPNANVYDLGLDQKFIDYHHTVSDIISVDLPLVGDKDNEFLVELSANGTADLNPTDAVSLPLTGHILLKALDNTIYDQTFDGSTQPTDHLTISTTLTVDPHTLDTTAAAVSVQLRNLNLLHFETPEIKLFSFGLPGVASIDAGVKFGLDANLSAGVKVGINPNVLVDPLNAPIRLGLMSPTFIQPSITGSATVEGDLDVLGFNAASLSGTVSLTLQVTFGLDNTDPTKVFPFDQLPLSANVDLVLGVHLEADVAIIGSVWSYDFGPLDFPIGGNNNIITSDAQTGTAMGAIDQLLANPTTTLPTVPTPIIKTGSSAVGGYNLDQHPQIVIDPASGKALSIQVVNASTAPGVTIGNLAFAQRSGGLWSAQTVLPSNDVSSPDLALTHDNTSSTAAAVVVYQATSVAGSPAGLTLNQKLTETQIRYRYFDGKEWGAEQSVTNESLMDAYPSVAFNSKGQGVLAWVHNSNPAPMDNNGNYSRSTQTIEAAVWNPTTHTWSAPMTVSTSAGVSDAQPATYVDDAGNLYIVWIRDTASANILMYSINSGSGWSAPAVLPITGLVPGGSFGNVAIGRDKLGRVNVLFSYRVQNSDRSVDSRLYNRPTAPAAFTQPAGVEQISQGANFTHLSTTNAADGSLVLYWLREDGINNGVFLSVLSRSSTNPSAAWSTPDPLTSTSNLTLAPSLAVDTDGRFQVLYDHIVPQSNGQPRTPAPPTQEPQVGVPLEPGVGSTSFALLPQLEFASQLGFPALDSGSKDAAGLGVSGNSMGQAIIVNRGQNAAQVTIDAYVGMPATGTKINTQQITLSPGASYHYSQMFPISAGTQTYSVLLTSATGEAIPAASEISTVTITGLPELAVVSLAPSVPKPLAGQPITLTADIKNLSNTAVGAFDVSLSGGDPRFPQLPVTLISTQHVQGLGGSQDVLLNFPLTLPTAPGDYEWTVLADSGNVIQQSTRAMDAAQYRLGLHADPAIVASGNLPAVGTMTATLLNSSGVSNVQVQVPVTNLGNVAIANVPVDLQQSRNGAPFTGVPTVTIPSLNPGQTTFVSFVVNGLAGDDVYHAFLDPSIDPLDANLTNDTASTSLFIHGLPILTVGSLSLSTPTSRQGDPLSLNAVIGNTGIDDASNVLVEVFAIPQSGAMLEVASTRVPEVNAHGQVNLSLALDTNALLGPYTLLVQVDRLHEIFQRTDLNNTAQIQATFGPNIPINNAITGTSGAANTITLRRDADGVDDDVWLNVLATGDPTQLASLAQPITINGGGLTDTLVLDSSNGNPLPVQLVLNGSFTTDALAIGANQTVTLAHTATPNTALLSVNSLTIDQTGKLDMGDGSVRIDYSGSDPLAAIQGYLRTGYDGGKWDGDGITSSDAQANPMFAIGETDSADGIVSGQPANTILLKYALTGDADENGKVDFADLVTLARDYNKTGADWAQGNFDYSGKVGFGDLVLLARNYNASVAAAAPFATATLGPATTLQALTDLLDELRQMRTRQGRSAVRR